MNNFSSIFLINFISGLDLATYLANIKKKKKVWTAKATG